MADNALPTMPLRRKMFKKTHIVRMNDTDAAGILFFANQFSIVHEVYEDFMESIGCGFAHLLDKANFFVPIVHAEADYKKSVSVGERLQIKLVVEKVGETSFTMFYALIGKNRRRVGTVRTVHVSVSRSSKKKIPLPAHLKKILKKHVRVL